MQCRPVQGTASCLTSRGWTSSCLSAQSPALPRLRREQAVDGVCRTAHRLASYVGSRWGTPPNQAPSMSCCHHAPFSRLFTGRKQHQIFKTSRQVRPAIPCCILATDRLPPGICLGEDRVWHLERKLACSILDQKEAICEGLPSTTACTTSVILPCVGLG